MHRFRLEPVLNHRKHIEEMLQKELSAYARRLDDEKKRLLAYECAKNRFADELNGKQRKGIVISENFLYTAFLDKLAKDIHRQEARVMAIEVAFTQKRAELIEAMKNRKTLDTLKEKELEAFNDQVRKSELDFLNEIGITQFNRKS